MMNLCQLEFKNRFQPRRRYCGQNERVQMRMTQEIEETVRSLDRRNSLKTHPFHLAHVNYYCKHGSGRYLGCEIALAEFSLVDGVRKTYHALINNGDIPLGYAFLATKHAAETHHIPLPPHYFGRQSDHQEILSKIKLFLVGENGDETKLPPLYTRPGDIDALESVLRQLQKRPDPYINARRDVFRVYSVSKLFHELRNESMGIPPTVPPKFLAEHVFTNDALEFTEGISCDIHEYEDAMRHCSLSYVQRWSFLIMEQCCGPLAIDMVPGKHCPLSNQLANEARALYFDSKGRCWSPDTVRHDKPSTSSLSRQPLSPETNCQETSMTQNELNAQSRAEGDAHVQEQATPWVRPLWRLRPRPLRPLRRPRALLLMGPISAP